MNPKSSIRPKLHSTGGQPKGPKAAVVLPDAEWFREMRRVVQCISRQIDELELVFRAFDVLEGKQAVRRWFNCMVPALRARPIDLCHTARGRRAVLRELNRIEGGLHP